MSSWKAQLAALGAALAATCALAPATAGASFGGVITDQDQDLSRVSWSYLYRLEGDEASIAQAHSDLATLAAQPASSDPIANTILKLEQDNAGYRYRSAIRGEQVDLLRVAADGNTWQMVANDAPQPLAAEVRDTVGAWHSMWHLAGIDQFNLVRIHYRPMGGAASSQTLAQYYQQSASAYQLDWTYLAAINFIESDFGRVDGPSSAGAIGPMQFMPATWTDYGEGDVNNPQDAINAAARYLFIAGGRRNMDGALYAYNHSSDYVAAVDFYADAIHQDPTWLDRLYYWNTSG
ncbi:MAG TPA: transglycosylase SLT domain-containing protein [Candidatus Dormibacteraeota bacterium]|nr:transglycosylase SLT domain-containing protein [Candidatus Dormibacteraeota bacterium]